MTITEFEDKVCDSRDKPKPKDEKSEELSPSTYWLTRIVYIRAISFIYFVAFLVAYHQNKELIGDRGLLPLKVHMNYLHDRTGHSWFNKILSAPTVLWLAEPWDLVNPWLDSLALAGATLSGLVFINGAANVPIMLCLWLLYHSIVNVGQRWYGFGWESQLLETGFIGVFMVPLLSLSSLPKKSPPPWPAILALQWLLIRIMLGAGLIKIRGDKCWRDLTCMNYHYQTQPVPNPFSYFMHQTPELIHKMETFGNHVVELIVPFFAFLPQPFPIICGVLQIIFQVILIISGNLSFLNWLTIVPSIGFFHDRFLKKFFTKTTVNKVKHLQDLQHTAPEEITSSKSRQAVNWSFAIMIGYLSLPVVINLLSSRQAMNTSFDPFRLVNTYGAFGSVTKTRHEVIFEGTYATDPDSSKAEWMEYEFKCKPGRVDKVPCWISPYHYRLDWLLWFAAFQQYEANPWLVHLVGKFLVNDEEVNSLIAYNPFYGKDPPRFVRVQLYKYVYTKIGSSSAKQGQWYKRKFKNNYFPAMDLHNLEPLFYRFNWTTIEHYKKLKNIH